MAVNDIANTQQFIVCNRKVWPQKIQFDIFFLYLITSTKGVRTFDQQP